MTKIHMTSEELDYELEALRACMLGELSLADYVEAQVKDLFLNRMTQKSRNDLQPALPVLKREIARATTVVGGMHGIRVVPDGLLVTIANQRDTAIFSASLHHDSMSNFVVPKGWTGSRDDVARLWTEVSELVDDYHKYVGVDRCFLPDGGHHQYLKDFFGLLMLRLSPEFGNLLESNRQLQQATHGTACRALIGLCFSRKAGGGAIAGGGVIPIALPMLPGVGTAAPPDIDLKAVMEGAHRKLLH
jgi:hypothetical protein